MIILFFFPNEIIYSICSNEKHLKILTYRNNCSICRTKVSGSYSGCHEFIDTIVANCSEKIYTKSFYYKMYCEIFSIILFQFYLSR